MNEHYYYRPNPDLDFALDDWNHIPEMQA